jgi:hypothetical protein
MLGSGHINDAAAKTRKPYPDGSPHREQRQEHLAIFTAIRSLQIELAFY